MGEQADDQGAGKRRGNPRWVKGGPSPNPSGRARGDGESPSAASLATAPSGFDVPTVRLDGWQNLLTRMGTHHDKTTHTRFRADVIDSEYALDLWRGDPIAARIVETIPNECLRQGFEVVIGENEAPSSYKVPAPKPLGDGSPPMRQLGDVPPGLKQRGDGLTWLRRKHPSAFTRRYDAAVVRARRDAGDAKPLQEAVTKKLEALHLGAVLKEVMCYERAGGGGAILLGANDYTTDLREPLDLSKVRSLDWITPLEARELIPLYWYNNPRAPKFGQPAIYQLIPYVIGASVDGGFAEGISQIHESRLVIFPGARVSRRVMMGTTPGWGDSVFTRCITALTAFNEGHQSARNLLADFSQAIWKIKGLAEMLSQQGGAETLQQRMMIVDLCRSVLRASVVDSDGEDFERKSTPMSGFPETLDRLAYWLAASSDMPLTLLMGTAAAGMNASGASDVRFFYDRTASVQTLRVAPAVMRVVDVALAAMGEDPETIQRTVKFKPLWQPTEQEIASAHLAQAQADAIYLTNEVVSPEEMALSRFGGASYSFETHLDFEARAAQQAVVAPIVDTKPAKTPPAVTSDPFGALAGVGALPAGAGTPKNDPDEPTFKTDGGRADYSPDQDRDEGGRFAAGGGGSSKAPAHAEHASAKANAASATASGAPTAENHAKAASAHRNAKTAHEIAGNTPRAESHGAAAEHHAAEAHAKGHGEHGKAEHGHEHAEHGLLELGKAATATVVGEETASAVGLEGEGKD